MSLNGPGTATMSTKSKKQVGFLLSKGSPLKPDQKAKLRRELKQGTVTVKRGKRGKS